MKSTFNLPVFCTRQCLLIDKPSVTHYVQKYSCDGSLRLVAVCIANVIMTAVCIIRDRVPYPLGLPGHLSTSEMERFTTSF